MNNYAFFCLNRGAKAFDVSKVTGVTHTTQFQLSFVNSQLTLNYLTLFQFNLRLFIAKTTSLHPINKAPAVGVNNPIAAKGMAMML